MHTQSFDESRHRGYAPLRSFCRDSTSRPLTLATATLSEFEGATIAALAQRDIDPLRSTGHVLANPLDRPEPAMVTVTA